MRRGDVGWGCATFCRQSPSKNSMRMIVSILFLSSCSVHSLLCQLSVVLHVRMHGLTYYEPCKSVVCKSAAGHPCHLPDHTVPGRGREVTPLQPCQTLRCFLSTTFLRREETVRGSSSKFQGKRSLPVSPYHRSLWSSSKGFAHRG